MEDEVVYTHRVNGVVVAETSGAGALGMRETARTALVLALDRCAPVMVSSSKHPEVEPLACADQGLEATMSHRKVSALAERIRSYFGPDPEDGEQPIESE